jgi:predicted ester cyclase
VIGDTVVLEITWTGTHTGPMMSPTGDEIPATGKSLEMRACIVNKISDGKVAMQTQYFDIMTMMTQLGLVG